MEKGSIELLILDFHGFTYEIVAVARSQKAEILLFLAEFGDP